MFIDHEAFLVQLIHCGQIDSIWITFENISHLPKTATRDSSAFGRVEEYPLCG